MPGLWTAVVEQRDEGGFAVERRQLQITVAHVPVSDRPKVLKVVRRHQMAHQRSHLGAVSA